LLKFAFEALDVPVLFGGGSPRSRSPFNRHRQLVLSKLHNPTNGLAKELRRSIGSRRTKSDSDLLVDAGTARGRCFCLRVHAVTSRDTGALVPNYREEDKVGESLVVFEELGIGLERAAEGLIEIG
jgi:hypothetical protein